MMKVFWILAAVGCAVLCAAAVWMGALNQDEGWYLYAANLVAEGKLPYRDFFFTQGPVMPCAYAWLTGAWRAFGLIGARIVTVALGLAGIVVAMALVRRHVPETRRDMASLTVALLLGCNLYHLYYLAIPKTYALAGLFALIGTYLADLSRTVRAAGTLAFVSGISLALAAGTRISLGAILPVVGVAMLLVRSWKRTVCFAFGAFVALAAVYGPFLLDDTARAGLVAAQAYHAARGGFDITWCVGSLSRLVRWYLPVFIVLGLGAFTRAAILPLAAFFAVFTVQMLAPFPYEDYQVPVMALLAVYAAANFAGRESVTPSRGLLLALGLCFATSFGSPLLEKWTTNGQDRFWSLKKDKCELAQLRDVADEIEAMDPGGRELFTQDLYLAIETDRKVPEGLEMGPFSMLSDERWRELLSTVTSPVAALSGYSFAIDPPSCRERPIRQQMDYWQLLKRRYEVVDRVADFGQNATPLLILRKKP